MPFISYAQNFEDVLLWRALGHVENGFYIDVGANHPVEHSVTKAFYDHGWHGINIEPLPTYQRALQRQRPRDTNLAVAAGAADGAITLFDVPAINGWATTDAQVASAHRAEGHDIVEITVPLRTLSSICAEHVSADIHFLKIDVEGCEADVLRGMDLEKWRPWILVIEAMLPNSKESGHRAWESLVTAHRYEFAYFDGLNRYYVAQEHRELLPLLAAQPNVFDDFISTHLARSWQAERAAQRHIYGLQRSNQKLAAELNRARAFEQQLAAVYLSRFWRATEPLRWLIRAVGSVRRLLRKSPKHLLRRLYGSERARTLLMPLLQRFPLLGKSAIATVRHLRRQHSHGGPDTSPPVQPALPLSAQAVLRDLEHACVHPPTQ